MDSPTASPVGPEPFPVGVSAFEAPIPPDASPALTALVANEVPCANTLDSRLSASRLGVASSLFRALRLKHPPTANHCLRVALGCSVFASFLKLDDITREQLEIAALLHDIGKLGVPDQILNKPDRLDANEYQIMERHLAYAVHMLETFCDDQMILDIVRYSSAWYDGSRPQGCDISGDALPMGARILAIQNAFDAMTTDMVYRHALPRDRAIAELFENTPTQFDPKLVSAFCEAAGKSTPNFNPRSFVDGCRCRRTSRIACGRSPVPSTTSTMTLKPSSSSDCSNRCMTASFSLTCPHASWFGTEVLKS